MGEPYNDEQTSAAGDDLSGLSALHNQASIELFDIIDTLSEFGLGEVLSLPQIIVVGDQSSGKSSVLEAISRQRFPKAGGLCTRFATELVLRRCDHVSADVRIRWADGGDGRKPYSRSGFRMEHLPDIIDEAKELMGIANGGPGSKSFSKDVLRIEICRPDLLPLKLVDLPGIFHSTSADQSGADKALVDELVQNYMRQANSIILAVVSANIDPNLQAILDELPKADPDRTRTLGVITKPDLAPPRSANEAKFLALAKNEEPLHRLSLGWHVLKNCPESEDWTLDERDAREASFFPSSRSWGALPEENRGITTLRQKLSRILLDHIKNSLPKLVTQIEDHLATREKRLEKLGPPRDSVRDMMAFLLRIADDFQRIARSAVAGSYRDEFEFFGEPFEDDANENASDDDPRYYYYRTRRGKATRIGPVRKLRAIVRKLNCTFHAAMVLRGAHQVVYDDRPGVGDLEYQTRFERVVEQCLLPCLVVYDRFPEPEFITKSQLSQDMKAVAVDNQGREFPGTPNTDLVFDFFKKQSGNWKGLANQHLEVMQEVVREFVEQLLLHVVGTSDEYTMGALAAECMDPFFRNQDTVLQDKVGELFTPYESCYCVPIESHFGEKIVGDSIVPVAATLAHPTNGPPKMPRAATKVNSIQDNGYLGTDKAVDLALTYHRVRNIQTQQLSSTLPRLVDHWLTHL